MLRYWIEQEYYRLHVVEEWPDSPYKHVLLIAISSKLESLARQLPPLLASDCLSEDALSRSND